MLIFIGQEERSDSFWTEYQGLLEEVVAGKRGGVYNGASFTVASNNGDTYLASLNSIQKSNPTTAVMRLLVLIYVENKTPSNSEWNLANYIIGATEITLAR